MIHATPAAGGSGGKGPPQGGRAPQDGTYHHVAADKNNAPRYAYMSEHVPNDERRQTDMRGRDRKLWLADVRKNSGVVSLRLTRLTHRTRVTCMYPLL